MTQIAIDIGNTSVKAGIFKTTVLEKFLRFSTLEELFEKIDAFRDSPIIVSSVAHQNAELESLFSEFSSKLILNKETPIPIENRYESKVTLGYDRLAAAIGANGRFPNQNCLVVDIGTAIKYDFVNHENAFIGGIISAGRKMRFSALHTFTKKLPLVDANEIPELVGRNTESCLVSGVMNGIGAEINWIIEKYMALYQPHILLCGGDAKYFETQIKYPTFAAPNLVLEGLNRILLYNVYKV